MRYFLFIIIFIPATLLGQNAALPDTGRIIDALLSTESDSNICFDDSALTLSRRLGISYAGINRKCLIAYDLDDSLKIRMRKNEVRYSVSITPDGNGYDLVTVNVPSRGLSRAFYFRNGCLTSPFFSLTHGWRSISSRFFTTILRDSALTNPHAVGELDDFVLRVGSLLGFTDTDYSILEKQKILYYLCGDEDEIQHLTGFKTRGMYNLAYDAIVSTYNTHYHELTHLLVNFKLKHLPLFSHPFLQEGIAVALGGRGGLSADVVTELGTFLDESQTIRYPALLRRSDFTFLDASISYPAAGAYNRFLIESIGTGRFLDLYRRHCGNPGDSSLERISESELPPPGDWDDARRRAREVSSIQFQKPADQDKLVWRSDRASINERPDRYLFTVRDALLFGECDTTRGRRSDRFTELFPGADYPGHRYAALADSQSVGVYDLWTNTLIASYNTSFDLSSRMVPRNREFFLFSVPKSLFHGVAFQNGCPPLEISNYHR
jgi:hypothetical protein